MKLKIGIVVTSTLLLMVVLSTSFVFAQPWDTCIISCNCENYEMDEANGFFSFTVAEQSPGVTNSIVVANMGGENHEETLTLGDEVVLRYTELLETDPVYSEGSGFLNYQGPADSVTINTVEIPEFTSLALMLVALTFVAVAGLVYKKKLKY